MKFDRVFHRFLRCVCDTGCNMAILNCLLWSSQQSVNSHFCEYDVIISSHFLDVRMHVLYG